MNGSMEWSVMKQRNISGLSSQGGVTLISALVAVLVISMASLSLVSMQVSQKKQSLALKQKLAHIGLGAFITKVFYSGVCSCHFHAEINTGAPEGSLFLDTSNTDVASSIPLESIRTGCEFSGNDNVIVRANEEVVRSGGLVVGDIIVKDLLATGSSDVYSGNLVVSYTESSQKLLLEPISIPLVLSIDSSLGTPEARPIQFCWQGEGDVAVEQVDGDDGNGNGSGEIESEDMSGLACAHVTDATGTEDDGSSLVGCKTSDVVTAEKTALGFEAGSNDEIYGNNTYLGFKAGSSMALGKGTFLGFRAGENFNGQYNTMVGSLSGNSSWNITYGHVLIGMDVGRGHSSSYYSQNILIGTYTGQSAARHALFIGNETGQQAEKGFIIGHGAGVSSSTSSLDTFVGNGVGKNNQSLGGSVVVGYEAAMGEEVALGIGIGRSSGKGGIHRAFMVGFEAGQKGAGKYGLFLGGQAGSNLESGDYNNFIGFQAGFQKTSGHSNTYAGAFSGHSDQSATGNTCVGWSSCYDNETGINNTILGAHAGKSHLGSNNIFIGKGVGSLSSHANLNATLMVGTESHQEWLVGEMSSVSTMLLNGNPITIQSSRALKKNIYPVKNLKKYFQWMLETPLFTYQYKDPKLQPDKMRMGIISEELPEILQIKRKGKFSQPDWPSVYGVFAASIKWIYISTMNLEDSVSTKMADIMGLLTSIERDIRGIRQKLDEWVKNPYVTKRHIKQSQEKIKKMRSEIAKAGIDVDKKWEELMGEP